MRKMDMNLLINIFCWPIHRRFRTAGFECERDRKGKEGVKVRFRETVSRVDLVLQTADGF